MAVDHQRAKEILTRVDDAWSKGQLTKTAWTSAWDELQVALGDGPERAEGMESLVLFAQPDWLAEVTAR